MISTLDFHLKRISGTPLWSLYCETFCIRKPKLVADFFQAPEEQMIAFNGPHLFMINAAPVCRYHSMFLPHFKEKLQQEITRAEDLYLSIELLKASRDPTLRVLFNSFKAGASMNHLHFHLLSAKELNSESKLPIELDTSKEAGPLAVQKRTKDSYILPHFVVRSASLLDDASKKMADQAYKCIEAIKKLKKAYNVIIGDEGSTLYVVPRNEVVETRMGNGAIECSGVIICRNKEMFDDINQKLAVEHLESMSITDEELNTIENIFNKSCDHFIITCITGLSLIHICRCRRYAVCRSRWSPYH
eukprot:TRINITY_DN12345_c0_g3_i5.p1 TRINITY_DN12345_c0_g3~~TRINITY_DN12345_c0_g3_i5.p1  ORF type:complete len:303 (+),score=52.88 TRINITY_DN12345_c0_g3_i5:42-950(+)